MKDSILKKIKENQKIIESHTFNKELLNRINYKFRLDWNYHSNHLEGGTLTKEETRSVMTDIIDVRGKSMKDVAEMRGHDHIITDIIKIGKGDNRISERRIKDIHTAIMFEEKPENKMKIGKWKLESNFIYNYKNERIDFTKPNNVAKELHDLLDKTNAKLDLFFKDKKTEHPILIATKFHIDFISIHPFYDGNGRITRILTNLILISCGYPPIIIKNDVKDTYYKLLADIQVYGGNIDLLENFLGNRLLDSQQLILDVIDGKDIEEIDDIDKEIDLFKKQLALKEDVIQKRDAIVYKVYQESIKPLLTLFLKKHEQFEELFIKKETLSSVNNQNYNQNNNFDIIEDWMKTFNNNDCFYNPENTIFSNLTSNIQNEEINKLFLKIKFIGFKKDGKNIFNMVNNLEVQFNDFTYSIDCDGNMTTTKLYSEILTKEEINETVKNSVKNIFKKIKSGMNN